MAARALWKGQLRLSLVSIPVELYSAKKPGARIGFRQIHEPSGKPVHYEKVVRGVGPVDTDEIVKGYEYEKDSYLLLDPDEVDAIKLETKKTLELVQFVGACEIPPIYFDKPYYLTPADELAEDAYRVVRDSLRSAEKVGIGQITLRGREHLAAIKPCGDGLLLETLLYADEVREAEPLFASIADEQADDELLEVARALIDRKTAPFDPESYADHYRLALQELIDSKLNKRSSRRVEADGDEAAPRADNVIDLMGALKKSLEKSGSSRSKSAARSKSRTKAPAKSSGSSRKKASSASGRKKAS